MQTLTIARRELASYFFSPIAYVVLGLFGLGSMLIFFNSFAPGEPAELRPTLEGLIWLLIFLVPAISMRLISDELRTGTIEPLMTSPVTDTQVIVGKWLGAMGFFAALLIPLLVLVVVLEFVGDPEYGPIVTGLVGLLLVGGLYLAIGTFASASTQNQIIAFLVTIFIICLLTFLMYFLPRAEFLGPGLKDTMHYMNVNYRFEDFSKGLFDTRNFVYFISGIVLFLFFAVKMLESRRWR
jgi:ABC-2 type transport system permease protein